MSILFWLDLEITLAKNIIDKALVITPKKIAAIHSGKLLAEDSFAVRELSPLVLAVELFCCITVDFWLFLWILLPECPACIGVIVTACDRKLGE